MNMIRYRIDKSLSGLRSIKVENNQLCYQDKNDVFHIESMNIDYSMYECFWINGEWYCNGTDNALYTLEKGNKAFRLLNAKPIMAIDRKHNKAVLSYDLRLDEDNSNVTRNISFFDFSTNVEVSVLPERFVIERNVLYKDNLYYSVNRNQLSCLNLLTAQTEWSFSLDDLGRWYHEFDKKWVEGTIQQIVAVVNDTLWLTVSGHHLIGIDTRTGHLLYNISYASEVIGIPTKAYHQRLPVTFRLEHDPDRQQLFGFIYDTYVEVDLTVDLPSLTMYVLEEACSQQQVFCAYGERTCFDSKYFFYLDPMTGKIGCINRKDKVLEWVYSFPNGSATGVLMQIQVTATHLYVLDSGGTLHIFERES